jgi:formylglycine-generating enzyme required for sulfatase activity
VTVSEETLKDAPDHRKSVLQQAKRGAPSRPPTAFPSGAAQKPGFFSAGRLGRPRYFEKPGFLGPIAGAIGIVVLLLIAGVYLLSRSRTTKPAPPVIASGALDAAKQSHDVAQPPPAVQEKEKSPWDDVYVTQATTGEKIPHPLSRKTYKQTLADGTTVDVPEGMVYVPAGEFTMGENESEHKVYLDAYFIGKYEVTNAEWKVFCDFTNFEPLPAHWKDGKIPQSRENHPVVYVSWEDIQKYCEWASAQTGRKVALPTEAQWEKAARGPNGYVYPWGNMWDKDLSNNAWLLARLGFPDKGGQIGRTCGNGRRRTRARRSSREEETQPPWAPSPRGNASTAATTWQATPTSGARTGV